MRRLATVLVSSIAALGFHAPVAAEPVRTIYVVNHVTSFNGDRILDRVIRLWNWNPTTRLVRTDVCDPLVSQCVVVSFDSSLRVSGLANPWEGWVSIHPVAWNTTWEIRQALMCHELGHILGVGHTEQGCMKAFSLDEIRPGPYNRSIVPAELLFDWVV